MEPLLEKYCSDEVCKTGLFLLDFPTGFGKTYHILKYIYNNLEHLDKRKIFFITNLKKNLPYEELRDKFFMPNRKKELFYKSVLFIDSNLDFIINKFLEIEPNIPEYFKNNNAYWSLRADVKFVNDYEASRRIGKGVEIKLVEQAKANIREKHEPSFRRHITDLLARQFPKKRDRRKAIKRDPDFTWIGELYPPVFTDERKVYFLSIDKFFAKNTTIIEPSYYFHEHEITKNALIFIDEFDATKERILNKIIENGLDKRTDFIHLFNEIHTCLNTNQFPGGLLAPSEERLDWYEKSKKNGSHAVKMPEEILDEFKQKADEISEKFSLPYSYKTVDTDDNSRNLLFHDFTYHSVLQEDKKFVSIRHNREERHNEIRFINTKPGKDEASVLALLNQIRGFLNYFQRGVEILATNYFKRRKESDPERNEDYTFEAALHTVLDEFRLERRHRDFVIDNIVTESEFQNNLTHNLSIDLTVYDQGFRYYDFVDSDEHATQSKVYIYSFQNTPEKFLLKLARKAKIIGVSATANIESVTANYDIEYLKYQLGDTFLVPSEKELDALKDLYADNTKGYDQINIHVDYFTNEKKYTEDQFFTLFESKEIGQSIINQLKVFQNQPYFFNRYLKIGKCFKEFLLKDDMGAFLCLLNKLPKRDDLRLDLKYLEAIFEYLMNVTSCEQFKNENGEYDVKTSYLVLNSSDFDLQKEELTCRLSQGEKLFVISTYQTVGAGQNLQYASPSGENLVSINEFDNLEFLTDINGLYLDKPTNLLVNVTPELKEEDFVKYIFQLEFLQDHGDISALQLKKEVKFAFKNLLASPYSDKRPQRSEEEFFDKSLYKKRNYAHHIAKVVIQAVGRICRTNLKHPNIYVFADEDIYPYISGFRNDSMLLLKEFQAMINCPPQAVQPMNFTKEEFNTFTDRANTFSEKTTHYIKSMLSKEYWTQDIVADWKRLRLQSLQHPYLSKKEAKVYHSVIRLYTELPTPLKKYSFGQRKDFDYVKIDFRGNADEWVSEEAARLPQLMSIPGVSEYFKSKGWKTAFEEAAFLLNPPMFRNIYLGALGEEVGKFLLEEHLQIKLLELPEHQFERFDYKLNDDVFFDFKHWHESTAFDADEQHHIILDKLEKVNGKKVFIVNILAEGEFGPTKSANGRIIEIPYLFNTFTNKLNHESLSEIRSEITIHDKVQ